MESDVKESSLSPQRKLPVRVTLGRLVSIYPIPNNSVKQLVAGDLKDSTNLSSQHSLDKMSSPTQHKAAS